MARRQGATREHVLCDLRLRSNSGFGPFSIQPSGPRFFGQNFRVAPSASIAADTGASLAP